MLLKRCALIVGLTVLFTAPCFAMTAGELQEKIDSAASGGVIEITESVEIDSGTVTIDGGGRTVKYTGDGPTATHHASVFLITGGNVTLKNLTITGGKGAPDVDGDIHGGAVVVDSYTGGTQIKDVNVTLVNCTLAGNTGSEGSGLYAFGDGSKVMLEGCTFDGNTATTYSGGGMLVSYGAEASLKDCTFTNNAAISGAKGFGHGSGLYVSERASVSLMNCTFSGNTANGAGGGVDVFEGGVTVKNCTFTGNTASISGGGLYAQKGGVAVENCTFDGNTTTYGGGGVYADEGSMTVENCTFINNAANGEYYVGGGLTATSADITVKNCVFSGNKADFGGGMSASYCTANVSNCTFDGNTANFQAGGVHVGENSVANVVNCTFTGNKAASGEFGNGGGMLVYNEAAANVVNCTFAGNAASYRGHEVYLGVGSTLNAANTIFWNADAAKPAVYNNNAALRLYNCAYGSGTFTDGDGGCITGLDWSGRASVKQTAGGVEHTVFMLESGTDGELINGGLDASDVKAKLGLAVEPDLTKDQLGGARGDEPSIGAVEPVGNNKSTGGASSGCGITAGGGAWFGLLVLAFVPFVLLGRRMV